MPQFEIAIERVFPAAHAIVMRGERETLHGHNWVVRVVVAGHALDADGLLVDFHELERLLNAIVAPFNNANLNEAPPFDRLNPTAERLAEHVGVEMARQLPKGVALVSVSVTEAPGCVATYRP